MSVSVEPVEIKRMWSLSSFGASASACAVATSSTEDASIERDGKKLGGPIGPVPEPFQLGC